MSGGAFPHQLGLIQLLAEEGYRPDVTLASSGGNVAAYAASAADWRSEGIERVASGLGSCFFVRPWVPPPFPGVLVGYFEGSVYDSGRGACGFLREYFTPSTITRHEIWTGTYNRATGRAAFFCNRAREQCLLDLSSLDTSLLHCAPPVYLGGDIDLVAAVSHASASIPTLVPPQMIHGEPHIDGGTQWASPLKPLQEAVGAFHPLHLTYVNCLDLDTYRAPQRQEGERPPALCDPVVAGRCPPQGTIIDCGRRAASEFAVGQIVADRLAAHDIVREVGLVKRATFACTPASLAAALATTRMRQCRRSLLEIYPAGDSEGGRRPPNTIDITSFGGEDVLAAMAEARGVAACRFWWVGPPASETPLAPFAGISTPAVAAASRI